MKYLYIISLTSLFILSCSKKEINPIVKDNTITTSGHNFEPSLLNCKLGDTIYFELGSTHNAIQVSEENYNSNYSTPLSDGFQFGFGDSGFFVANESKTYYYVCAPHLPQMKARIVVE
tara:strand:- start:229 stop:582 length:354 start_codon:yes stop_codon:yes gene_type:complete